MIKPLLSLVVFLLAISAARKTEELPDINIEKLDENCYVYTSWGLAGGVPFPANGTYLVTESGIVLIDSPWSERHTQALIDSVQKRHGKKITDCIATHFHEDRTGGFDVLKKHGARTWSTKYTRQLCMEKKEKTADYVFQQDTMFRFGDFTLEIFYPGKGHSPDNIVVWIKEKKILHGGCFIKSTQSKDLGNLSDADTGAWKKSVETVMKKFRSPAYVIPGHMAWKNKKSLEHTLKLLKAALKTDTK